MAPHSGHHRHEPSITAAHRSQLKGILEPSFVRLAEPPMLAIERQKAFVYVTRQALARQ
jgi:hypothetical protein